MPIATTDNPYRNVSLADREQRILDHLPMVKSIARSFSSRLPRRVESADLVSAGTLGLIRAVDRYDPDRGVALKAFASRCVRESILDYLRAQDPLPYSTRFKIRKIEDSMLEIERKINGMPSIEQVAEKIGYSVDEVSNLMAQASSLAIYSLSDGQDTPAFDGNGNGEETKDILSVIERQEMKDILAKRIKDLPRAERMVLMFYYFENLKMKEIGDLLNITESRVSQIHAKAVTILRAHMRSMVE